MYRGTHCTIRTIEADDAPALRLMYDNRHPRAALLDDRRELPAPTLDELRAAIGSSGEKGLSMFDVIEDRDGRVLGFGSLRPAHRNPHFAMFGETLLRDDDYSSDAGREACEFFLNEAFGRGLFRKVVAQVFDWETELLGLLHRHTFQRDGVQRDVFHSAGRWHSLVTLTAVRPALNVPRA